MADVLDKYQCNVPLHHRPSSIYLSYDNIIIRDKDGDLVKKTTSGEVLKITNNNLGLAPTLPTKYTISILPDITDQGGLGDSVCNSAAYLVSMQTKKKIVPSRLMLYSLAKISSLHSLNYTGTTPEIVAKVIQNYGCCQEKIFPHDSKNEKIIPPLTAFKASNTLNNFSYGFISNPLGKQADLILKLKQYISSTGKGISFCIYVYKTFIPDSRGIVPVPKFGDLINGNGGHCVTIVGYDDTITQTGYNGTPGCFYCANSWGKSWGKNGFFYIPYDYLTSKNSSDFMTYDFSN